MYRCPECKAIFGEPDYTEICWEDYNGVSSMFSDRHYATFASCPECGEPIDIYCDSWDEAYEEEDDDVDE